MNTSESREAIVNLTPRALAKVRTAMQSEGREQAALRLATVKGGCSGYEYSIEFASEPREGDVVYAVDDLRVFVDGESIERLRGTVLDYEDGLYGAGLKFTNPNAAHSCGCGTSFATKES